MAERGARPQVPALQRRALRALRSLFTPLLPDDYLELINPLWNTTELRGRIQSIKREDGNAVTITIKPGWEWPGHEPGQYLRIGMVIDGVHHWRAYSLTSDPDRADGCICITPKLVEEGVVSPFLNREAKPGALVRLGGVEGGFVLPDPVPDKLLFVTAGSGITPVMSMLRHLDGAGELHDAVHLHSARGADFVTFGERLRELDARSDGYRLHIQDTKAEGRIGPGDLDELCPDWREREIFLCGPAEMLDAFHDHVEAHGDADRVHMERFQPSDEVGDGERGEGGTVKFLESDLEATSDGDKPILVVGEEAGADLPFGCRQGICHTCVGKLCKGKIRDLRTGKVSGSEGEMVRTCINAPEGPVEIAL
jgi:stearoyl-CoA 9-desaturase NADPH oxidoreductase